MIKIILAMVSKIKIKEIGELTNIDKSPLEIISARAKFFSARGPNTKPNNMGGIGKFIRVRMNAINPIIKTKYIPKILVRTPYAANTAKIPIIGIISLMGLVIPFINNFPATKPNGTNNMFAIRIPIKAALRKSGCPPSRPPPADAGSIP